MKTNTINNVIATARGTEVLLPAITGEQSLVEWAQKLVAETVTTKHGREISAARAALNGAQFAMSNVALALRCATELGVLPYTHATKEAQRVYTLLDTMRSGFAAVRGESHRELVIAELTLSVKSGDFDQLQSQQDAEPYTEEELLDMGLGWEEVQEFLDRQAAQVSLSQSALMDSDGSVAEDEGEVRVAVHDANQLWDMQLKDIKYAEGSAAAVALIGKHWPTHNPMWEPLLDRLADAWQAQIEYAEDKEGAAKKIERREQALENLRANPMLARWVINHVTRRVFRDMVVLELKAEEVHARLEAVERRAMQEERYGVPASVTRLGTGEQAEYDRKAYLLYTELLEAETARNQVHDTQVERDRSWAVAQLEEIEALGKRLKPLYRELRELDQSLAKLWELFQKDAMPSAPPVYWNMERFFLAGEEDAAREAIRLEMALGKQKAREAEGDALVKAAAMVAKMLGL